MTQLEAQKILAEHPGQTKLLSLNDGRQLRVESPERYLTGAVTMIILDSTGQYVYVAYRNIASIRILTRNGRTRRRGRPG